MSADNFIPETPEQAFACAILGVPLGKHVKCITRIASTGEKLGSLNVGDIISFELADPSPQRITFAILAQGNDLSISAQAEPAPGDRQPHGDLR